MTNQEAKEFLRDKLQQYLLDSGIQKEKGKNFICPFCGKGQHTPPASYDPVNKKVHCFSCGKTGDIFDIIGIVKHLPEFKDQLQAAAAMYGITINSDTSNITTNARPTAKESKAEEHKPDYMQYVNNLPSYENNKEAANYISFRGFTEESDRELLRHFVKFDQSKEQIIIGYEPDQPHYYFGRSIKDDIKRKAKGAEPLFCLSDLYNAEGDPIYITEGQIDALSIKAVGGRAVALCTVDNGGKLIAAIKNRIPTGTLIVALDNDSKGAEGQLKVLSELRQSKLPIKIIDGTGLYRDYKDANEIFATERDELQESMSKVSAMEPEELDREPTPEELQSKQKADQQLYITAYSAAGSMGAFDQAMNARANAPDIPTGYSYLDKLLDGGLYEGLYFIGAQTSVGKTTLIMQIADQLAVNGHDVLIFSLEMSKYELMARSVSRETYKYNKDAASKTRQIMNFKWYENYSNERYEAILKGRESYQKYADHIFILEGIGNIGTEEVMISLQNHVNMTGRTPIVIIDYIQLLAPSDVRMSDKQATDKNVLELKRISRDYKIPVIGISSLNRMSYSDQQGQGKGKDQGQEDRRVNLWSFKESGAIEYSNDVLFGLNTEGKAVNDVQLMSLEILKNRNGRRSTKDEKVIDYFNYYKPYNYFEETPSINGIQPNPIKNKVI